MNEVHLGDDSDLDVFFPVGKEDEDAFIVTVAKASTHAAPPAYFYFNRVRHHRATGISLHFSSESSKTALLSSIKALAAQESTQIVEPLRMRAREAHDVGEVFGGPDGLRVYRKFSESACPLLLAWAQHCEDANIAVRSLALDVLVDYLHFIKDAFADETVVSDAYPSAFISYRSHFEAFASTSTSPALVRERFALQYDRISHRVTEKLKAYRGVPRRQARPPWLDGWDALLTETYADVLESVKAERLTTAGATFDPLSDRNLFASVFHRNTVTSREFTRHAMHDPLFQVNRVVLGMTYLSMFRLGLPMIERYFLCYAVSRAVEEYYGIKAEQAFSHGLWRSRKKRAMRAVGLGS